MAIKRATYSRCCCCRLAHVCVSLRCRTSLYGQHTSSDVNVALVQQRAVATQCGHVLPVDLRLQQVERRRGRALRVDLHHRGGKVRPVVDVFVNILDSNRVVKIKTAETSALLKA